MNSAARVGLIVGLLAVVGAPATPALAAMKKVRVTIPALSANFAPYFIPIEKRYYAEEGLELEITHAPGGVATPALLSGTIDLSTSAASALNAILRGAALKIVYTMSDRTTYQLWSTQPDLKTLQDLKGKSVGVPSRGDTFELATRLTLEQAGLPQNWVSFTPLGFGTALQATIASGALPAVVLSSDDVGALNGSPALKRGHMIYNMFENLRMPYSGVAVSDKLLQTDPGMVTGFLRATMKGVRYMIANPSQTIAIDRKYDTELSQQAAELDYRDVVKTLTADGTVADDVLRKDINVHAAILNIAPDKIRPLDQIYDYRLLRAVNQKLDASGWKPTP